MTSSSDKPPVGNNACCHISNKREHELLIELEQGLGWSNEIVLVIEIVFHWLEARD